jgi:hypothetical protein
VSAVQSALGVGEFGRELFVLVMCLLQFTKAGSAATLPQQDKSKLEDIRQGRVNITDLFS